MRCRRNLAPQSALVPAQIRSMVGETLQIRTSVLSTRRDGITIVCFRRFLRIYAWDASRSRAHEWKGLADVVNIGKAFCFALGYAIWARSLVVCISSQFRC